VATGGKCNGRENGGIIVELAERIG
jgi:hypothetical protein